MGTTLLLELAQIFSDMVLKGKSTNFENSNIYVLYIFLNILCILTFAYIIMVPLLPDS